MKRSKGNGTGRVQRDEAVISDSGRKLGRTLTDEQLDKEVLAILKKHPGRKLGGVAKIMREQGMGASHKRIGESLARVAKDAPKPPAPTTKKASGSKKAPARSAAKATAKKSSSRSTSARKRTTKAA